MRHANKVLIAVVGSLVGLVVLYVLSSGPAVWLWTWGWVSTDALNWYIAPLDWLFKRSELFAHYWIQYMIWWRHSFWPAPDEFYLPDARG